MSARNKKVLMRSGATSFGALIGYQRKGVHIVGVYMAMIIENGPGLESLVRTVSDGYETCATVHNSVAEGNMNIWFFQVES